MSLKAGQPGYDGATTRGNEDLVLSQVKSRYSTQLWCDEDIGHGWLLQFVYYCYYLVHYDRTAGLSR